MESLATILIAARNASATIRRAVRSAASQRDCSIVLVDDFSSDDTVALAKEAGGARLRVIRPAQHFSLGLTRQAGLNAVATPYGVWLDSDDEFLPGRVERLVTALQRDDSDLASDAIDLFDGATSRFLQRLPIPEFLKGRQLLARLFERNYLQGIGCHAFRTSFAKRIGYDPNLHGSEDMDFALRSVAAGARFSLLDEPGYRVYAYSTSLSRQRDNQQEMYRRSLLKHDYDSVKDLLQQAGYDARVSTWALVSMAVFRREFEKALEFVDQAESLMIDPQGVLEPSGPCPMPEAWRVAFFRGSIKLEVELWTDAEYWLRQAEKIQPTAEGANNLGIAVNRLKRSPEAEKCFTQSLERFPDYSDAQANKNADTPSRVTLHPLRREPSRRDY